jgi:hypothetical protein
MGLSPADGRGRQGLGVALGKYQTAPRRASSRSIAVRPPGSGQRASAAQGLRAPSATGRGQHHPDRIIGVGPPGGMDPQRLGARPGPDPAATTSPPSRSGAVAPRASGGQAPLATRGRVVTPTVGSPRTAPRCTARPARRGWSRPVALTTSTSGVIGRARTARSSSGPSRRASRAGRYGPPAGPLTLVPASRWRRWVTAAPANPASPAAPAPWVRSKQTKQAPIRCKVVGGCQRPGVMFPRACCSWMSSMLGSSSRAGQMEPDRASVVQRGLGCPLTSHQVIVELIGRPPRRRAYGSTRS